MDNPVMFTTFFYTLTVVALIGVPAIINYYANR